MAEADGKMFANALYHGAVVSGLAIGYAQLGKKLLGGGTPSLDIKAHDMGMVVLDLTMAMATEDMLIKQGIIPTNIIK